MSKVREQQLRFAGLATEIPYDPRSGAAAKLLDQPRGDTLMLEVRETPEERWLGRLGEIP